jgi:hypothetical protein
MRLWTKTWQCFQDDRKRILILALLFFILPWCILEIMGSMAVKDVTHLDAALSEIGVLYLVCCLITTYGIYSIVYAFYCVYFSHPFGIIFPGTFFRYCVPTFLLCTLVLWLVKAVMPLALILSLCMILTPALQLVFHMKVWESFTTSFNSRYCPENRFAAYLHAVSLGAIMYVSTVFTIQGLDYVLSMFDFLPKNIEEFTWHPVFGGYLGYFMIAFLRILIISSAAVAVFGATTILLCYFRTRRMDIRV